MINLLTYFEQRVNKMDLNKTTLKFHSINNQHTNDSFQMISINNLHNQKLFQAHIRHILEMQKI